MRRSAPSLPDIDDAEFAAKLRPLGDAVIPKTGQTNNRISGPTDTRSVDHAETRRSRLSVAEHIERIEQVRGPKRRFEYLIPVRVARHWPRMRRSVGSQRRRGFWRFSGT